VDAVTNLDSSMVAIETNPSAIKQILTNLIKNASEALPSAGRITVETQALVNLNGRNYVEIVISDNGPGIPPEVQEKLFTPVETTKGDSHSGLGLSIVKNLIDELDGSISCRSGAKNGTRFEILIPRITDGT
jgi:signal transduction histidine kinase